MHIYQRFNQTLLVYVAEWMELGAITVYVEKGQDSKMRVERMGPDDSQERSEAEG